MTRSLVSAFLLGTLSLFAADSHDRAVESLLKVPQFAFGGVGFAGVTSEGEKDCAAILARPSAQSDFEKAFQAGNIEAKCYALVALFKLNHDKFIQLAAPLRKSAAQVNTMTGCVMGKRAVSAVVSEIETGMYSPKR
jgi:hypothetical protein